MFMIIAKSIFILSVCSLLLVVQSTLFAQKLDMMPDLSSLVETERAFSKFSEARGMRDAFLNYLADDAILFRPEQVNGKEWIGQQPVNSGTLKWELLFADVSSAGDLGYTTGPYQHRPNNRPVSYGHYVSIWKKQQDNKWKVVIDLGIQIPQQEPVSSLTLTLPKKVKSNFKGEHRIERDLLLNLDRDFTRLARTKGTAKAIKEYLDGKARLFRMNRYPFVGEKQIKTLLSPEMDVLSLQPVGADVAQSLDLGYTYGTYDTRKTVIATQSVEIGNYVRIWKRISGDWKLVLEILNPVQPKQ
jgi:ketosteroid isomerase-like protein